MDSKTEEMFISLVTDLIFVVSSTDWNLEVASLFNQLVSTCIPEDTNWIKILDLLGQIYSLNPKMEFVSLTNQTLNLMPSFKLSSEWKVLLSLVTQIFSLVSSMNLDSESELISFINQIVSFFNSKPDSESELVSLIAQTLRLGISVDSDSEPTQESELVLLISQLVFLKPEPELTPLIRQIISRCRSMNWEPLPFISFCPQALLNKKKGCAVIEDLQPGKVCRWFAISFKRCTTEICFHCQDCNGKKHEEYDKAPVEVKHPLHPKHSLQAFSWNMMRDPRECYCCDKNIGRMFYYCSACDFAMTFDCVRKPPPVLSIEVSKWHDHPLALFPSQVPYPCSLCALTHSSCPLYICPPCDFVVHQNCLTLPKVIKISRHPHHRISFTPSFGQGDRCCRVCQRKIDNDYGGYSCIKDGCSYAAHSRCATQSNVWNGIELEGVPEEIQEEVLEPFVRISEGIIQHFSHQQHHLRLDENASRDYDENKLCQACITPIYFGNFYFCLECEFLIHEKCANLPRKLYHPIHPHRLNLVERSHGIAKYSELCSACLRKCPSGFFYECGKEDCSGFKLNVQCATTSEPLVHESHMHPLFLTSKPGERRKCSVCKHDMETFNCVDGECDFSLCFGCATIPQKVRYKHDKHMLTLSYGEETGTMSNWCEVCEKKVNPMGRFYKCDEYCCVTLHMDCLIGKDLYMKPGSSWFINGSEVGVLPNNQMSRPFCSNAHCKKRCPYKIVVQRSGLIFCSIYCMQLFIALAR